MDTNLWIGGLAGVAATLLVLGGLAVVTATAGGMDPMGMGEMGSMMDRCQQMMDDHEHEHQGGHDHGNATDEGAHTEAIAPSSVHPADPTPTAGSLAVPG